MNAPEQIPPGLEKYTGPWQEVDWHKVGAGVGQVALEPGRVATGLRNLREFSQLEERICLQLAPDKSLPDAMGNTMARNRLGSAVTPPSFHGSVSNCQAFVYPFDLERVKRYPRAHLNSHERLVSRYGGFIMLCTADIRSGGKPFFLLREVAYFRSTASNSNRVYGWVRRQIGWSERHDPLNVELTERDRRSRENAERRSIAAHLYRYKRKTA